MNAKLNRVLDEIARTEEKIAVWREHLEELNIRKKQLEDAEIIKSVRAMRLGSREMLAFLEKIQNGTLSVRTEQPGDNRVAEAELIEAENNGEPEAVPAEREDREDEEKD